MADQEPAARDRLITILNRGGYRGKGAPLLRFEVRDMTGQGDLYMAKAA